MADAGRIILENIKAHSECFEGLCKDRGITESAEGACRKIAQCLRDGGKLLICGNGGSAADSNHLAAEFINRYAKERRPLGAISLAANASNITSIANDYSFEEVFSKQVSALAGKGDILIAISTSGKSPNILAAINAAKAKGVFSILFTGNVKTPASFAADLAIAVPSSSTPRIQEMHLLLYHMICDCVERELFEK